MFIEKEMHGKSKPIYTEIPWDEANGIQILVLQWFNEIQIGAGKKQLPPLLIEMAEWIERAFWSKYYSNNNNNNP